MDRQLMAALALLAALVAGCGDAVDSATGPAPSSASPSEPGADEPPESEPGDEGAGTTVTSISLQRSGGLAGVLEEWRLTPGDKRSDRAFELAARRSVLEAEAARLDEEPVCCDFFVHRLTVQYEDGTFRAVVDDDPGARLIWELVDAVAGTSPDGPAKPRS